MSDYVSCDPGSLDPETCYPDGPELIEGLIRAGSCASASDELYPPRPYPRPPAALIEAPTEEARADLARQFALAETVRGRGVGSALVRLDEAVVLRNVLYVGTPGGRRPLYESHMPWDRLVSGPLDPACPAEAFPVVTAGPHLYLGSQGSFNYGHWLLEDMPRLKAVELLRRRHPGETVTLLLPGYDRLMDEVRERSVRLFLGTGGVAIRFVKPGTAYGFRSLYYATPIKRAHSLKSLEGLDHLDRVLRRRAGREYGGAILDRIGAALRPGETGDRLFVDRNPLRFRHLLNKSDVLAVLKERGFRVVNTERMSLARQVRLFARARIVAGIMGAGMTNTVFSPPGTAVIHLAPSTFRETYFWDLAANRGHSYTALYGEVSDTERPDHLRDFTIDPAILSRALDAVG